MSVWIVECDGMLTASDDTSQLNPLSVYYTYNHSININQQQQKREPSLWITGNITTMSDCTSGLRAFAIILHAILLTKCNWINQFLQILTILEFVLKLYIRVVLQHWLLIYRLATCILWEGLSQFACGMVTCHPRCRRACSPYWVNILNTIYNSQGT